MNIVRPPTRWSTEWLQSSSDETLYEALHQAANNTVHYEHRNTSQYLLWKKRAQSIREAFKERPLP